MSAQLVDSCFRSILRTFGLMFELAELRAPAVWALLRQVGATPDRVRAARRAVPVPGRASYDILDYLMGIPGTELTAVQLAKAGAKGRLRELRRQLNPHAAVVMNLPDMITFFSSWRQEKRVYRLTSEIADGLRHAQWPAQFPTSHLMPPASAVVLEVPSSDSTQPSRTLLVHLNLSLWDTFNGSLSLWIMELCTTSSARAHPDLRLISAIDLDGTTLDEAFEKTRARAQKEAAETEQFLNASGMFHQEITPFLSARVLPLAERNSDVKLVINALLYIAHSEDVVADVLNQQTWRAGKTVAERAREGHKAPALASHKQTRAINLAPAKIHTVGVRFSQEIARYLRDEATDWSQESDAGSATQRKVRPHMRAPHMHLYWTGEGRQIPRIRFIAPVFVGGGEQAEESPTPVVRRVR
jgi:hypothetical protein